MPTPFFVIRPDRRSRLSHPAFYASESGVQLNGDLQKLQDTVTVPSQEVLTIQFGSRHNFYWSVKRAVFIARLSRNGSLAQLHIKHGKSPQQNIEIGRFIGEDTSVQNIGTESAICVKV